MATSQVKICNLALVAIGHTLFIESMDDDSEEADVCKEVFDQVLDEVLEDFEWPFATRHATPAQLTATSLDLGAVPSGWTYAFALPADCVPNGLRRIYPGTRNPRRDQEVAFAPEHDGATDQTVILTDEPEPEFIYTARVTNYALFSASFAQTVAFKLAEKLVPGLRKDVKLAVTAAAAYQGQLARATANAMRNVKPDIEPDPGWLANR